MSGHYALNSVTLPYASFEELAGFVAEHGLAGIELRHDLDGVPFGDGSPATEIREQADAAGIAILAVHALQRFDLWNAAREREAAILARTARDAGSGFLVLAPVHAIEDVRDAGERGHDLRRALRALAPMLADCGIQGLVEPVGLQQSSLRSKRAAIDAIDETATQASFLLLHDCFHHALSGDAEIFPQRTGLVHISGIDETSVPVRELREWHRGLVGQGDRLGTVAQLAALREGGYRGAFSFEVFSSEVHDDPDAAGAILHSAAYIDLCLGSLPKR